MDLYLTTQQNLRHSNLKKLVNIHINIIDLNVSTLSINIEHRMFLERNSEKFPIL